jgi:hypothetical protein
MSTEGGAAEAREEESAAQQANAGKEEEEEDSAPTASAQFPPVPVFAAAYGPPVPVTQEDGSVALQPRALHPLMLSRDPPAPPPGKYRCFGEMWDPHEKAKTLAEEGREELFARPADGKALEPGKEITKLCDSLSVRYAEFLRALGDQDDMQGLAKAKTEEFETLYINLLYLVNQLRPAQGREALIAMMRDQCDRRRQAVKQLNELVDNGEAAIQAAIAEAAAAAVAGPSGAPAAEGDADARMSDATAAAVLAKLQPAEAAIQAVNVFDLL